MALTVHGFCEPPFRALEEAFRAGFEAGEEIGASLSLIHQGRTVVDLWGGSLDREGETAWDRDTVVLVASTVKVAVVLSLLMLVSRGRVDLDAPVADYWPEFAQGGKGGVLVRHALSHRAGVPGLDPPISLDDILAYDPMVARIAAEPHWFGGEPRLAYHALTHPFLIGELVRRVDGRGAAQFVHEELAVPLEADFNMGVTNPAILARRCQPFTLPPGPPPPGLAGRIFSSVLSPENRVLPRYWGRMDSTLTNGRAIARVMSIIAGNGAVNGRRYLSAELVAEVGRGETYQQCPLIGWLRMGLGFGMSSEAYAYPTPDCLGWGGVGGSWALADPKLGYSLGYAPNNWEPNGVRTDPRQARIGDALRTIAAAGALVA